MITDDLFDALLIDYLESINSLGSGRNDRNILLNNLSNCPIGTINRSDAAKFDLFRIVKEVHSWGFIESSDKYALEILMENTRGLVRNTSKEKDLNSLKDKFNLLIRKEVTIPFVIISMNSDQAAELDSGTVFRDKAIRKNFKKLLRFWGFQNLAPFYNTNGILWEQLQGINQDIHEIINNSVDELNGESRGKFIISLKDISSIFLSTNEVKKRQARNELENFGGLVIIDILSLFHPDIQNILLSQSKALRVENSVALVVISPLMKNALEIQKIVKDQIYKKDFMSNTFYCFENLLDPRYEFGVDEICKLRRWLTSNLLPENRTLRDSKIYSREGLSRYVIGVESEI